MGWDSESITEGEGVRKGIRKEGNKYPKKKQRRLDVK